MMTRLVPALAAAMLFALPALAQAPKNAPAAPQNQQEQDAPEVDEKDLPQCVKDIDALDEKLASIKEPSKEVAEEVSKLFQQADEACDKNDAEGVNKALTQIKAKLKIK